MDEAEREVRKRAAEELLGGLADRGVGGVATTFVDNAGVTRVKTFPLSRLPHVAAWGVGISTSFDRFRADDQIAGGGAGIEPVGDLRIIPDLRRVVPLSAQPGWAWTPGDRYAQTGFPHPQCARLLLQRVTDALAVDGIAVSSAFEIEWVVSQAAGDDFEPAIHGPGYSMARLIDQSDYCRDVLRALEEQGVSVDQLHPEYAAGQLEVSVAAESPVAAADTSVLVRATIRAVGRRYGFRTSYSPKVAVPGVGNGGHIHLSLSRDGESLLAGGEGPFGLTDSAASFAGGILDHLPALLAVGASSPVSYLRLVPSHWAGVYRCWGLENREAALRLVTGSAGSESWAANLEVKCFDLLANPYLLLAGLLVSGAAGLSDGAELPDPVDVDPAVLDEAVLAERGIERLPTTLGEAVEAFAADDLLVGEFGPELSASLVALRRSEIEQFADVDEAGLAAATRWRH